MGSLVLLLPKRRKMRLSSFRQTLRVCSDQPAKADLICPSDPESEIYKGV